MRIPYDNKRELQSLSWKPQVIKEYIRSLFSEITKTSLKQPYFLLYISNRLYRKHNDVSTFLHKFLSNRRGANYEEFEMPKMRNLKNIKPK